MFRGKFRIIILAGFLFSFSLGSEEKESPFLPDSAWPVMRGDLQNTGKGRMGRWQLSGEAISEPRIFSTGNGIFSTPIIDDQERIYVGSADHYFYALDPKTGKILWRFDAGELIDSAGVLSRDEKVYVPAGAGIYALDLKGNPIWEFEITKTRPKGLYTFSTNYWWEGNVALGPDHNLYAGNDDFFFYSISPEGKLRWAYRTGFFIWSVPAFALEDNTFYFAGFDMKVYALDQGTGRLKWKKNLKNPLVASPALGSDDTLYQAGFDGRLYALDSKNGKIKWSFQTASHIYGSPALAPDYRVYITSTDGFLYALKAQDGELLWTFYTGDAVRSSPVVGPDPEGRDDYLIYFGGGQGELYAIEPSGKRRWSFNTLVLTQRTDYPNLNASPALGKNGIAIANANGDVFYVPYDYYLKPDAKGITRDPSEGFQSIGAYWYYLSPGGLISREPISSSEPPSSLLIHSSQVILLRLLVRTQERIAHCQLSSDSLQSQAEPAFNYRLEMIGDKQTIAIIPEEMLKPGGEYLFKLWANYQCAGGRLGEVKGFFKLKVEESQKQNPILEKKFPGFVLTHLSFPQPAIVPSLNQIGISIMRIPFSIVRVDPEKKSFVAWAVQKYGESAGGEEKGLPMARSLFYAFSGRVEGEFFMMESRNCFFEESAFPFPLDLLRFSGKITSSGTVEKNASTLAELDPPPILEVLGKLKVSSEQEPKGQQQWLGEAFSGADTKGFLEAILSTGPTVMQYITGKIWKHWNFYNDRGKFIATGTFRMQALQEDTISCPQGLRVKRFEYLKPSGELVAEVEVLNPASQGVTIAILVVDERTGKALAINYNTEMRRFRLENGNKQTILQLPKQKLDNQPLTAYLMADLYPLEVMTIR